MSSARLLRPGDEGRLERFLLSRPDTTMFLRSNLRDGGLVDRGERGQGTWAAALRADAVVAAAQLCWNGVLVLEAPEALEELARLAVASTGRELRGLVGPAEQVRRARACLGLAREPAKLDSEEDLFALELGSLRVPPALANADATCRPPRAEELALVTRWRTEYAVETLGERESERMREAVAEEVRAQLAGRRLWVLETGGELVSTTAFNATIPGCVQVGGVYTPPDLRGRGFARAAVGGSLLAAREEGAGRAILFTAKDDPAAQACYRGLGFARVGDYALVLLESGWRPG